MRKLRALFAIFALCFIGCATTRIDWDSRIGNYTFDDAVMELGVPDRQATLADGSTVGEWLTRRGGAYGHAYTFPRSWFYTYDITEMPDHYLRLVFGPDRKLVRTGKFAR